MAQVVPLKWSGSYAGYGGPLGSGESHFWWARGGAWGNENRFYLFSAFCEGVIAADIEVAHVSHFRRPDGQNFFDETHFEIHNKGSDAPVYYAFYMAWSDPINV